MSANCFVSPLIQTKQHADQLCHLYSSSICFVDSVESVDDTQDEGDYTDSDYQPVHLPVLSLRFAFRTCSLFTPIHNPVSISQSDMVFRSRASPDSLFHVRQWNCHGSVCRGLDSQDHHYNTRIH